MVLLDLAGLDEFKTAVIPRFKSSKNRKNSIKINKKVQVKFKFIKLITVNQNLSISSATACWAKKIHEWKFRGRKFVTSTIRMTNPVQ
jgi:hypothetical protein